MDNKKTIRRVIMHGVSDTVRDFKTLIIQEHALFYLIMPYFYISSFYYNTFIIYCELTINCQTSTLPMTLAYYSTDVAAPAAKHQELPSDQGFIGSFIRSGALTTQLRMDLLEKGAAL
jgi:hypothetical protein